MSFEVILLFIKKQIKMKTIKRNKKKQQKKRKSDREWEREWERERERERESEREREIERKKERERERERESICSCFKKLSPFFVICSNIPNYIGMTRNNIFFSLCCEFYRFLCHVEDNCENMTTISDQVLRTRQQSGESAVDKLSQKSARNYNMIKLNE